MNVLVDLVAELTRRHCATRCRCLHLGPERLRGAGTTAVHESMFGTKLAAALDKANVPHDVEDVCVRCLKPGLRQTTAPLGLAAEAFRLSTRQVRVLQLISEGATNQQIGHKLGIGATTVKTDVSRILLKLRARDRAQAVSIALREGVMR